MTLRRPVLLATAMDGTVLGDEASQQRFYRWGQAREGIFLAYIAGWSIPTILDKLDGEVLPRPDFVAGGVGTQMVDLRHQGHSLDDDYAALGPRDFPSEQIRRWGQECGLKHQQMNDQHQYKISFYWDGDKSKIDRFRSQLAGVEHRLIVTAGVYVDVLPKVYGKGEALRFIASRLELPLSQVVVAGAMENDVDMFDVAGHGILPANAFAGLKEKVQGDKAYESPLEYAAGVLDGLAKLGLA